MKKLPQRGDVWWAYLDPTVGHEQLGRRPVVIISADEYQAAETELVLIILLTSTHRSFPSRVPIVPPDGGLTSPSDILIDQLRAISTTRLGKRIGSLKPATLWVISQRLRLLLDLD